jgi:hypothetical protein
LLLFLTCPMSCRIYGSRNRQGIQDSKITNARSHKYLGGAANIIVNVYFHLFPQLYMRFKCRGVLMRPRVFLIITPLMRLGLRG